MQRRAIPWVTALFFLTALSYDKDRPDPGSRGASCCHPKYNGYVNYIRDVPAHLAGPPQFSTWGLHVPKPYPSDTSNSLNYLNLIYHLTINSEKMKNLIATTVINFAAILLYGLFVVQLHAQGFEENNAKVPDRMDISDLKSQVMLQKAVIKEERARENQKADSIKAHVGLNESLTLIGAGLCPDDILQDAVQSYPELHKDWIYNDKKILHGSCFPKDTTKPKRLSIRELRQLPFRSMSDSVLRIRFATSRNKGVERMVMGGIVVGAALVGVASGVRNFELLTGQGADLIGASFVLGGSLSTISFISAGRNLRKAKRIRNELIRRGQM